jgi:uncharacterized protein YjiS (DUF1127 family)
MKMPIALLMMRIIRFPARLKRAIETELAVRQAIAELSQMNDHMLRDLGITRIDIENAVRRPGVRFGADEGLLVPGDERASILPKAPLPEYKRVSPRSLVISR